MTHATNDSRARAPMDGIFASETVQQFVHIMQAVAMSNLNEMRAEAQAFVCKNPSVSLLTAFRTCIGCVRKWNRTIIVTEREVWIQRYGQLEGLMRQTCEKCIRAYDRVKEVRANGMRVPPLGDFLYFFLNNFVASADVVNMDVFNQPEYIVQASVARAVRQTILDCITMLYFPEQLVYVEKTKTTNSQ